MLAKLKSFYASLKSELLDIWNRGKMLFLAIGAIIVAIEFEKIKQFLLVYMGQKELKKDNSEDQSLAQQEKEANDRANELVKQSEQENTDDDWNKK